MIRRFAASFLFLLLAFRLDAATAITPKGRDLVKALDSFDVEHHWLAHQKVNWETGDPDSSAEPLLPRHTHCSAFAAAACKRLGVMLLRPPQHRPTFLATAQGNWLLGGDGRREGWRKVSDGAQAQDLANQGEIVVAVYRNPDPKKPGHIAIIRASDKSDDLIRAEGPDITQAGGHNYRSTSLKAGFRGHVGAFENNEILFFAHEWNGKVIWVGPAASSVSAAPLP